MARFHRKLSSLHTLLIPVERWDCHKKCAHFCLLRFYKYVTLSQGNVSTLKTTPNEVTEPPSLHSRQTRASWVSDSDEACVSLLSEG